MTQQTHRHDLRAVRWLTYLMFMMFAMTTDAVGVVIPEVMKAFDLGLTAAGLLHYGPMVAIAIAGMCFGHLADKLGRKHAIILGLALFAANSFLFVVESTFWFYLTLMVLSGLAIGIFKTAALALIGDITRSSTEHTATMNGVEAFFGVGAIIGPLLVTYLLNNGMEWKWLYVIAAVLCVFLILAASRIDYPQTMKKTESPIDVARTLRMVKDPYAFGFSMAAFLYVATESAIYVWMPTYLLGYQGQAMWLALYALPIFFILRAGGRFIGMWMMAKFNWAVVMVLSTGVIAACFLGAIAGGKSVAVYLLPLSGLFMSVIYPTVNSKGISCFEKHKHGAAAGVILFFTALGAAAGPLLMGIVSDANGGDPVYGFIVATGFAFLLFLGFVFNLLKDPTRARLQLLEQREYQN